MKWILTVLFVLLSWMQIEGDEVAARTPSEELRAAISKLWEPLDWRDEFSLDRDPMGRRYHWSQRGVPLGRHMVHQDIDDRLAREPAVAFRKIERHQAGMIDAATLLGRLATRQPPPRTTYLQWITNKLQAINVTLDHLQPAADRVEKLEETKRNLLEERWDYHNLYYAQSMGPRLFSVEEMQAALDPGTVVLLYFGVQSQWDQYYWVYQPLMDHYDLVVVARDRAVEAHRIDLGEAELRRLLAEVLPVRVDAQGESLETPALKDHSTIAASRQLYEFLIAPAEKAIASSERVVIVPDGLLYSVPFAALTRPSGNDTTSYFVEWKPLHLVQSISIYLYILSRREQADRARIRRGRRLLAVGAPDPPAVRRGRTAGLERLPGTRREVNLVANLMRRAGAPVDALLGRQASEKQVKEKSSQAAYLHFATHGVGDPKELEQSYLTLALPEGLGLVENDGILEAWEVADQLDTKADLVVLSACETALGAPGYGDGLLSLAHAFQMAGAQSVIASLWRVPDDSTADLMARFYRNLLSGMPKDRALQEAQTAMICGELGSSRSLPFHWAAFQLVGDWR